MKKKTALVLIGNGMAGVACLEELIKAGASGFDITVFGAERRLNYNRVMLSHVLTGEKEFKDIITHDAKWYDDNAIKLHTGRQVSAIKRASRVIVADGDLCVQYDKLILATGSVPIMPQLPGIDKKGVMSFRDMDDCDRIKEAAEGAPKAVVIGGGLLGLEAAYGLLKLGADVTVVHLMDRLMERQLDAASAAFLKEDLEALGIRILLGRETVELIGGDKVEAIRFKDGGVESADMVVMSIGIRPNIALAQQSGIYCEKGVVVSDTMQSYDPSVFAVGECVQHRCDTFGLVGPIFEQARVLVNHLAGDARLVFKNRPTSTRLKIPGIDLYSAGEVNVTGNAETIEYMDKAGKTSKRLILRDGRLVGIVMYGETSQSPELFGDLLDGKDVRPRRHTLLLGAAASHADAIASIDAMPMEAIVCGCNGITKGMIVEAIEKKGLFTREDVRRETKASGSCGGCAALVDRILEATLGSSFQAASDGAGICACTKYTRDDIIKNIKEKKLTSVMAVMETLGWETVGCDTCRPAINYYVSMVWPKEAIDDRTSRLVNERAHANIQKDGTFSVVPRIYGGVAKPEELKRIAEAAIKYNAVVVKLTGGQRIDLIGIKREDLPMIWKEIGMPSGFAYAKALRTVKTCVGSLHCRYGTQDSMTLGIDMEKAFSGLCAPAKIKMSVSGCPRNCAEASIKDVGIVGVAGGWELYVGGCAGIELKAGEKLCTVKTDKEVMEIAGAFLQIYREEAHYGERTFKWLKAAGFGAVKKAVVDDIANRRALYQRLLDALAATSDPWLKRAQG
ncbi:MAG: nitrite reductase large subunit NirB [Deltaproteobacteria bacterium]